MTAVTKDQELEGEKVGKKKEKKERAENRKSATRKKRRLQVAAAALVLKGEDAIAKRALPLGYVKMKQLGVPPVFLQIMLLLACLPMGDVMVDMVEAFAGEHRVTKAFWHRGFTAVPVDICLHPAMDICSAPGQLWV